MRKIRPIEIVILLSLGLGFGYFTRDTPTSYGMILDLIKEQHVKKLKPLSLTEQADLLHDLKLFVSQCRSFVVLGHGDYCKCYDCTTGRVAFRLWERLKLL
jgi:hypothetical protein